MAFLNTLCIMSSKVLMNHLTLKHFIYNIFDNEIPNRKIGGRVGAFGSKRNTLFIIDKFAIEYIIDTCIFSS